MDPYRTSQQVGTCPRCANSTESDGELLGRLRCVRSCGEWYPKAMLERVVPWTEIEKPPGGIGEDGQRAQATSWPWGAAPCPMCRADMRPGHRADVRYDYCGAHGVWLDSGEIWRFTEAFKLT
jgi:hypothetical protein